MSAESPAAPAAGLGATSAHTRLELPATAQAARVLGATTLPCLLLGGDVAGAVRAAALVHGAQAVGSPEGST